MTETGVWRSSSMEGKWKDGKGDVALRIVEYYGNVWLDLRIMNTTDGKNQHTRHGVRLTLEQAREMLPRLAEAIERAEDMREKKKRESTD
jgi:hypothetical protein|tara:strand:+ start:262 stop:531 length:270 start_codon:yes stop_codon:yes gene_type:complete